MTRPLPLIRRGANRILADFPGVLHVAMLAPLEMRIENIMAREHYTRTEAAKFVAELEEARIAFFRKFFKVHPNDPELYHLILNAGKIRHETAAQMIIHAVEDLARAPQEQPA